jgi:hypothetical protein
VDVTKGQGDEMEENVCMGPVEKEREQLGDDMAERVWEVWF